LKNDMLLTWAKQCATFLALSSAGSRAGKEVMESSSDLADQVLAHHVKGLQEEAGRVAHRRVNGADLHFVAGALPVFPLAPPAKEERRSGPVNNMEPAAQRLRQLSAELAGALFQPR